MNLIDIRKKAEKFELCDHCLGRLISLKFKGKPVENIGASLRTAKKESDVENNISKAKPKKAKDCFVCKNLFEKLPDFEKKILKETKKYEFDTFLIGDKVPNEVQEAEEKVWAELGTEDAEPIKREINRTMGKNIEQKIKKIVDFNNPDAVFTANFGNGKIEVQLNSVFIFGNYTKLVRGIPQTKWPCRQCNGRGCKRCNNTGKMYQTSVEEQISEKAIPAFKAVSASFHGQGREDIDALMLGNGRPFVLELFNPVKRKIDLKKLEKDINKFAKGKVQVSGLRISSKQEVIDIKKKEADKIYSCIIECKGITKKDIEKINKIFQNVELKQLTPTRVAHRRADKVRKRKVIYTKAKLLKKNTFQADIKAQSGTYIKELISGDNGRTKPNFSDEINKPCRCIELNVLEVCE